MAKTYSPEEVRLAVLKRCQELVLEHNLQKKEKHEDEKQDKEVCEECCDEEVKEHEEEMHKKGVKKSSCKLKNFIDKKNKKKDLKKMFGGSAPAPAAPQASIAEQINFGGKFKKGEEKVEKCGDQQVEKCGEQKVMEKQAPDIEALPKLKKPVKGKKPVKKAALAGVNPPKDPMGVTEKVKKPVDGDAPPKPKAATTLKDFMAKRKK